MHLLDFTLHDIDSEGLNIINQIETAFIQNAWHDAAPWSKVSCL